MPDRTRLKFKVADEARDLRDIRLPGIDKNLEELTISELVQLRPGGEVQDTYEVDAVTDNASVTTSSMLARLGRLEQHRVMNSELASARINELRGNLGTLTRLRTEHF